jgi:hypothetical protein
MRPDDKIEKIWDSTLDGVIRKYELARADHERVEGKATAAREEADRLERLESALRGAMADAEHTIQLFLKSHPGVAIVSRGRVYGDPELFEDDRAPKVVHLAI